MNNREAFEKYCIKNLKWDPAWLSGIDDEGDYATEEAQERWLTWKHLSSQLEEKEQRIQFLEKALEWQPIETAPKDGTHILLLYWKGGKGYRTRVSNEYVVTQAHYLPEYYPDWDTEKMYLRGGEWYDALDRLLFSERSKVKKNIPKAWMPLPKQPVNEKEVGE